MATKSKENLFPLKVLMILGSLMGVLVLLYVFWAWTTYYNQELDSELRWSATTVGLVYIICLIAGWYIYFHKRNKVRM